MFTDWHLLSKKSAIFHEQSSQTAILWWHSQAKQWHFTLISSLVLNRLNFQLHFTFSIQEICFFSFSSRKISHIISVLTTAQNFTYLNLNFSSQLFLLHFSTSLLTFYIFKNQLTKAVTNLMVSEQLISILIKLKEAQQQRYKTSLYIHVHKLWVKNAALSLCFV